MTLDRLNREYWMRIILSIFLVMEMPLHLCAEVSHIQKIFQRVLYINSYDPSLPHSFEEYRGIISVLNNENIILSTEFMDCKRFPDSLNILHFKNYLSYKLSKTPRYDVIIVSDDNAFDFVLDNQNTLFKNIPIVFFGVNNGKKVHQQNHNPWVTGIIEDVSFKQNIDLMLHLFPQNQAIYVIHDNSVTGNAEIQEFKSILSNYPRTKFKYISLKSYTFSQFFALLPHISSNDPVLLLDAFSDKNNKTISFKEAFHEIHSRLKAPLFYTLSFGIGKGAIGGNVYSFYKNAQMAANIAVRILNGENIRNIEIKQTIPSNYIFDYNELSKFNINISELPKGSIIINKPISFFEVHQTLVITTLCIIVLLVLLIILLFRNIVKRKRTAFKLSQKNKELESSMNRIREGDKIFRIISKQSASGIVVVDFGGYITYANTAFCKILGYNSEELIDKSIYRFIKPDYRNKLILTIEASLIDDAIPLIFIHKNGNELITDFVFKSAIIDNKEQFLCTIHDITQTVKTRQELIEAKEKAEESDRLKSVFIHNLSHEIKTPLNGIVGFTDLLSNNPIDKEENAAYIEIIRNCTKQLERIINDILEISRLDTKQVHVIEELTNLNNLISDQYYIFLDTAKGKGLYLKVENGLPDEESNIIVDDSKLIKIISNLIENAFKFTGQGGITIGYNLRNDRIILFVKDTGIGIPAEKQRGIFERFAQADQKLSRKFDGLGLGLAIAKENTELLSGSISIESEPGKGSTFYVNIPYKKA